MKKQNLWIAFLLLGCYLQTNAQQLLLPNGSFENDFSSYALNFSHTIPNAFKDGKVTNWNASPVNTSGSPFMLLGNNGNYAFGRAFAACNANTGIFTDYSFQMGRTYKISFYVNVDFGSKSMMVKAATGLVNGFIGVNGSMPNVPNEVIYQNNNLDVLPITNVFGAVEYSKVTINYTPTANYSQLWICGGNVGSGVLLDYVEIDKCPAPNRNIVECPTSFAAKNEAGVYQNTNLSGTIDAAGGIVRFSGTYNVKNHLTLTNGTFKVEPGTILYVDGPSCSPYFGNYTPPFGSLTIPVRTDDTPLSCSPGIVSIQLKNATLDIYDGTITAKCKMRWSGVALMDNLSKVVLNSTSSDPACYSTISQSVVGIYSLTGAPTINVNKGNFENNKYGIYLNGGLPATGSTISNSIFVADAQKMYKTIPNFGYTGSLVPAGTEYPDAHITLRNGNYSNAPINNNTLSTAIRGVEANNASHKITANTFQSIYMYDYLNYAEVIGASSVDFYAGSNTTSSNYLFQNNTIQLPSNWPATPQLPTTNKTSYGIFNTMRANAFNNVIIGADNVSFNLLTRIGVYNASPFSGRYWDNSLSNLHQGMRLKTFNNGTAELLRNNFVSNLDAIRIANAGATSSLVTTSCNSFTNPAARAGTAAIRVEEQAFLNSLQNSGGGNTYPNANAFSGMARPIEFLGQNSSYASFNYLRSTSAMENPSPINSQISSTDGPSSKPFLVSSYAGGCTGTTGAKRVGIAEEVAVTEGEAKEMLNQIRFKYVNAQDQNQYLRKVIAYYGVANKMGDLYTWQKPMNRFNKRAANTLGLFLMDYFRADGKETEAQAVANALLVTNADSKEIAARVKYFNLPQPTAKNKTARTGDATDERDEVLKELAYSGTSVADLACMLLRLNTTNADCPEPDTTASNARSGNLDPEDMEEEVSTDTYLGNCLPNPAKDETVIYFYVPEEASKGILHINNAASGAFIKEYTVTGKDYITLNLNDFASGVYTYTLQVNDIPVATKKLVVVK